MENQPKQGKGSLYAFKPQKPVDWFSPVLLAQTGISALVSSVFGAFSDKREMQAALDHSEKRYYDFSLNDDLWFDYVSDVGDGFDPTYSVAKALAEPKLELDGVVTKRGDMLIMGGDQVYPKASRDLYEDRFKGPYSAAYPLDDTLEKPTMFAIPGNHDWYDGLSNFLKIFCQKRTIGNWQTAQSRSYFAIKLSHNWWVWGIDIQLESDVDEQQKSYFLEIKKKMPDGARVILCTAEPSWVCTSKREDVSYHNLHFFEEYIICDNERDIKVGLTLAGDLHHYSRYESENKDFQRITAGGGGAFLHPTHHLPEKLVLANNFGEDIGFDLKECYPKKADSKRKAWSNWRFPYVNRWFTVTLGAYFMVMLSLFHSWVEFVSPVGEKISEKMANGFTISFVGYFLGKIATNPLFIFVSIVFAFGFIAFTDTNPMNSTRGKRYFTIGGCIHAGLQLGLFVVVYLLLVKWNYTIFSDWINNWRKVPLIGILSLETFVIGGLLSSHLFGFYLVITNRFFGMHDNEAFSALRSASYKNFLRLNLQKDKLVIYPVGIRSSPEWKLNEEGVFVSDKPIETELIENPIVIDFLSKKAEQVSIAELTSGEV